MLALLLAFSPQVKPDVRIRNHFYKLSASVLISNGLTEFNHRRLLCSPCKFGAGKWALKHHTSSPEEPWPLPFLFLPFPVLRILSHPPGLLFLFLDCVVGIVTQHFLVCVLGVPGTLEDWLFVQIPEKSAD